MHAGQKELSFVAEKLIPQTRQLRICSAAKPDSLLG